MYFSFCLVLESFVAQSFSHGSPPNTTTDVIGNGPEKGFLYFCLI